MRILKRKEQGYRFNFERFDLNGVYAGKKSIPVGILILYVLVNDCNVIFRELSAEAEGELGEEHYIMSETDKRLLNNLNELASIFRSQELVIWELTCDYNNVVIHISGRTYGSILSIRTPMTESLNLIPLMRDAETATYNYHDYDFKIVDTMRSKFNMNQRVTIQTLVEMERYGDIFDEFIQGMQSSQFMFPSEKPVVVEGHTARELFENYPLSELGAYNYLIYLRKNPKEALDDLKKGLPRK